MPASASARRAVHRNITVTVLLVLITGFSWWLMTTMQQQQEQTRIKSLTQGPNQYMENFTSINTDEQGRPRFELNASFMAHFRRYDRTDLTDPKITLHQPDRQQSWTIDANKGTVLNHGDEVYLNGNVIIKGRDLQEKLVNIETSTLRILPKKHFAETQANIRITRNGDSIDAHGARLYLEQHVLYLQSKVRGTYVPES